MGSPGPGKRGAAGGWQKCANSQPDQEEGLRTPRQSRGLSWVTLSSYSRNLLREQNVNGLTKKKKNVQEINMRSDRRVNEPARGSFHSVRGGRAVAGRASNTRRRHLLILRR